MIDEKALFKLSYGLYIAGVEWGGKKNACIINTAAQATAEPNQMLVTMLKSNYTTELIQKKGSFTVSVLSLATPLSRVADFGFRSGRECEKFEGIAHGVDGQGNPYLAEDMAARMSVSISQTIDLGTHLLFIGPVTEAEELSAQRPMTYADYRVLKAGGKVGAPEEKAEKKEAKYVCSVCHYVYDGEIPFEELPDDYVCPICKRPKSVFVKE